MTDPLGLLGQANASQALRSAGVAREGCCNEQPTGPTFKELMQDQIRQVNELQQDAEAAAEDLATGRRTDLEGVILASQKADTAFKMLLQVRNKVMDAYDELRQMRV